MAEIFSILKDLDRFGPAATDHRTLSLAESESYCRQLATGHYENFTVTSQLLPRHLRQHFCHIYAYCRWADDLADEIGDPRKSLELLDWWERELEAVERGEARHPVFIALRTTIQEFQIPGKPFHDLLAAFRRDQIQTQYDTFAELLEYCRYSANPVGHLILYLARCYHPANVRLSDAICTGLQLANLWQDVHEDYARGRIYLPQESRERFDVTIADFERRKVSPTFRNLLAFEVDRAEHFLIVGQPLVNHVPQELKLAVDLFTQGGLEILARIRQVDYDVWERRPRLGKWTKLRLVMRAWWRRHQPLETEEPRNPTIHFLRSGDGDGPRSAE